MSTKPLLNNFFLGGGGLYVPHLSFKPFHVAISEGSHVAVRILSKATVIDIRKCLKADTYEGFCFRSMLQGQFARLVHTGEHNVGIYSMFVQFAPGS